MSGTFWKHVNIVLQQADLILEVLDARFVKETRNQEIENKIARLGKKILYVINKCDLVNLDELRHQIKHLQPSIYISSIDKLGTTILKKKILEISQGQSVVVGVLGYPNVGKSSVINALAGKKAARTSSESGFTKGRQKVRVGSKITLLDTPGVFPQEGEETDRGFFGAVDYSKIKDAELVVLKLIGEFRQQICSYYSVSGQDAEDILRQIAIKLKRLRKGNEPDLEAAARHVLKEWQTGKIKKG